MTRQDEKVYESFDSFLEVAAQRLEKRDNLTPAWLSAVGTVSGTAVLTSLLSSTGASIGVGAAAVAAGMVLGGPVAWLIAGAALGAVATGTALGRKQMKKLEQQSTASERQREIKRLTTARAVYEELKLLERKDPEGAREEIEELIDDLVSGRKIIR
jgi:hypothetical protein